MACENRCKQEMSNDSRHRHIDARPKEVTHDTVNKISEIVKPLSWRILAGRWDCRGAPVSGGLTSIDFGRRVAINGESLVQYASVACTRRRYDEQDRSVVAVSAAPELSSPVQIAVRLVTMKEPRRSKVFDRAAFRHERSGP